MPEDAEATPGGSAAPPGPSNPAGRVGTTDLSVTADERRVLGIVPGKPVAGERKEPEDQDLVMVWPHLLVRHAVAAMSVLLTVMLISVFVDAPLRDVANPTNTPNPEKAPWYFAALQELLSHFHPLVAGVLVPGAIVCGLIALPYIDRSDYIRPRHRKVAVTAFTTFMVVWIVLTIIGFAFRGPNWGWVWPWNEWHGEL
ncbi:MAG: menaquinol-cytochrome c reductase cytochrome b subunit [Microthrixaceae bacterium]